MRVRRQVILLVIGLVSLLSGCQPLEQNVSTGMDANRYEYNVAQTKVNRELLSGEPLTFGIYKALRQEGDELYVEPIPFLTEQDRGAFNWDGQALQIRREQLLERIGGAPARQGFVLKVRNEELFYGEFLNSSSSALAHASIRTIWTDKEPKEEYILIYTIETGEQ